MSTARASLRQLTLSEPERRRMERLERESRLAVERLRRMLRAGRLERTTVVGVVTQLERAVER